MRAFPALCVMLLGFVILPGCSGMSGGSSHPADGMNTPSPVVGSGPGFPEVAPWLSFYGSAASMGDLRIIATRYRVINIDADPDMRNFSPEQIAELRADGRNKVFSYLNIGACENNRTYWHTVPRPLKSCFANSAAQLGPYDGFMREVWMNPADPEYQRLILDYVAPRLAETGVDGFFLDNMELVEHGPDDTNGPCDATCSQGGLDLVRKLREKFPNLLLVMQNATSDVTMKGTSGGVSFPLLLDGISHEAVYAPRFDETAEAQLKAWRELGLSPSGQRFFIGTEDYVAGCDQYDAARIVYAQSRENGFSPYAFVLCCGQFVECYWGI